MTPEDILDLRRKILAPIDAANAKYFGPTPDGSLRERLAVESLVMMLATIVALPGQPAAWVHLRELADEMDFHLTKASPAQIRR